MNVEKSPLTVFFVILSFLVLSLAFVLYVSVYRSWRGYVKETKRYRKVIATPMDILDFPGEFFVISRPNEDIHYVEIHGEKFQGLHVYLTALEDVQKLKNEVGCLVNTDYLYDKSVPLSKEEFQVFLRVYQKRLEFWNSENQGRPDQRDRPKAPYDFSKMSVKIIL